MQNWDFRSFELDKVAGVAVSLGVLEEDVA